MLEGKSKKSQFQEMSGPPHWKIKMSKNKTKILKKEPREMEILKKKDEKKERWVKKQWKMIFHEMILD